MAHRVMLIREWDNQHTGSGCCGRAGGGWEDLGDAAAFRESRECMEAMGAVYMALRAELPDEVELTVADPRNMMWLVPAIWRDARRAGASRSEAWAQVRRGVSPAALICDGEVLFAGEPPEPHEAVEAVLGRLAAA